MALGMRFNFFVFACQFFFPKGDVTRDDSQRLFLAQHSVGTLFRIAYNIVSTSQRCVVLKIVVANPPVRHHINSDISPLVREPRTVLDSGFHVVDSGFKELDAGFFVSRIRIRIQIVIGIPKPRISNSTRKISWIPDSTGKDFPDSDIRMGQYFDFLFLEFTCRRKHVFFNRDSLLAVIDTVI